MESELMVPRDGLQRVLDTVAEMKVEIAALRECLAGAELERNAAIATIDRDTIRIDMLTRDRDAALARVAEVERERDALRGMVYEINDDLNDARRVAKRLAGNFYSPTLPSVRAAVATALAYEVEP